MSLSSAVEPDLKPKEEAPVVLPPVPSTPSIDAPIPASSGVVPGLSSGGPSPSGPPPAPKTSAQLLTELAMPQVFPGPKIDVQKALVGKLEDSLAGDRRCCMPTTPASSTWARWC